MTSSAKSVQDVFIRLTDERWSHITEEHNELTGLKFEVLETIEKPEKVFQGNDGEQLAARPIGSGKWVVVVYRQKSDDGFVITAFLTRRIRSLQKRKQLWP
jgi:hypothetical protein